MDTLIQLGSIVGSVLLSLGGFEFIKWVVRRRYGRRMDEAEADKSEFSTLREQIVFLQEQLLKKEERFAEQTNVLRETTKRELELVRENTMLKTERSLKLCERRMCGDRQPQSGY